MNVISETFAISKKCDKIIQSNSATKYCCKNWTTINPTRLHTTIIWRNGNMSWQKAKLRVIQNGPEDYVNTFSSAKWWWNGSGRCLSLPFCTGKSKVGRGTLWPKEMYVWMKHSLLFCNGTYELYTLLFKCYQITMHQKKGSCVM